MHTLQSVCELASVRACVRACVRAYVFKSLWLLNILAMINNKFTIQFHHQHEYLLQ